MDHYTARIIDLTNGESTVRIVQSDFTREERSESNGKGEKHMHNKEQREQQVYFRKLADALRNFEWILLFGPTNAKTEFLHFIRNDHQYDAVRIETEQADNMTDNQLVAFVKDYFSNVALSKG